MTTKINKININNINSVNNIEGKHSSRKTTIKNMWKVSQNSNLNLNAKIKTLLNNNLSNTSTLQHNFTKMIPNSTANKNKKFISFI